MKGQPVQLSACRCVFTYYWRINVGPKLIRPLLIKHTMTDFTPNTTTNGNEWDTSDNGEGHEVELDYEYCVGPATYNMATGTLFLTRDDLVAMLAAIDEGTA